MLFYLDRIRRSRPSKLTFPFKKCTEHVQAGVLFDEQQPLFPKRKTYWAKNSDRLPSWKFVAIAPGIELSRSRCLEQLALTRRLFECLFQVQKTMHQLLLFVAIWQDFRCCFGDNPKSMVTVLTAA